MTKENETPAADPVNQYNYAMIAKFFNLHDPPISKEPFYILSTENNPGIKWRNEIVFRILLAFGIRRDSSDEEMNYKMALSVKVYKSLEFIFLPLFKKLPTKIKTEVDNIMVGGQETEVDPITKNIQDQINYVLKFSRKGETKSNRKDFFNEMLGIENQEPELTGVKLLRKALRIYSDCLSPCDIPEHANKDFSDLKSQSKDVARLLKCYINFKKPK